MHPTNFLLGSTIKPNVLKLNSTQHLTSHIWRGILIEPTCMQTCIQGIFNGKCHFNQICLYHNSNSTLYNHSKIKAVDVMLNTVKYSSVFALFISWFWVEETHLTVPQNRKEQTSSCWVIVLHLASYGGIL